jgi:trigger factor
MIAELEQSIIQQGGNMNDYLSSIKKTKDDLRMDFIPRAIQRVQTAVLLKEVGKREHVEISDKDIDEEIDRILAALKPTDTEGREQVISPDYREFVGVQMKNRKVVQLLKEKGVKKV